MEFLNVFTSFENVACIYRDYMSFGRVKKFFILIRISLEIVLSTTAWINNYVVSLTMFKGKIAIPYLPLIFQTFNYFAVTFNLIFALRNKNAFKAFIDNLMIAHNRFKNDPKYSRNLNTLKYLSLISTILMCTISVLMSMPRVVELVSELTSEPKTSIMCLVFAITEMWVMVRFVLEYFVIYTFDSILYIVMERVNASLSLVQMELDKNYEVKRGLKEKFYCCNKLIAQVQYCSEMYALLEVCSKQLSKCVGLQVIIFLAATSLQYIFGLYAIISMSVNYYFHGIFEYLNVVHFIVYSAFTIIMVCYSGQKICNQTTIFNRSLAKLYTTLSIYPDSQEMKLVKDLNRLVKIKPINIEMVRSHNLGLHLIPMILSTTISQVIVALQFNHII